MSRDEPVAWLKFCTTATSMPDDTHKVKPWVCEYWSGPVRPTGADTDQFYWAPVYTRPAPKLNGWNAYQISCPEIPDYSANCRYGREAMTEAERLPARRPAMTLTGDDNTPAMPMTEAEVNHLRRLLAWMRCEWMLDDDMQRGYLKGAAACVAHGFATPEQSGALIAEKAEQINQCPAYVRQAVKMLTKALHHHERKSGIVEAKTETVYLSKCPNCGGPADNGHDRCFPPNPYWCSKCEEQ